MKKTLMLATLLALSATAVAKGKVIGEKAAARAAQAAVGGRVVDVDYERRKQGRSYYQVEIKKNGREYKVIVDANSGRVLRSWLDDDEDDHKSRGKHHKQKQQRHHHDDDDDEDDEDDENT